MIAMTIASTEICTDEQNIMGEENRNAQNTEMITFTSIFRPLSEPMIPDHQKSDRLLRL